MRMTMKPRLRAASALLLASLVLALPGCSRPPEEERLRETVQAMESAVLERRPADFMEHVAEDFIGSGSVDRAALHNLLRAQLLRNASVGVARSPLDIEMQPPRATVRFNVVLTGSSGGMIPERAQGYDITSGWRLDEDGEWVLFLAEWKPGI